MTNFEIYSRRFLNDEPVKGMLDCMPRFGKTLIKNGQTFVVWEDGSESLLDEFTRRVNVNGKEIAYYLAEKYDLSLSDEKFYSDLERVYDIIDVSAGILLGSSPNMLVLTDKIFEILLKKSS